MRRRGGTKKRVGFETQQRNFSLELQNELSITAFHNFDDHTDCLCFLFVFFNPPNIQQTMMFESMPKDESRVVIVDWDDTILPSTFVDRWQIENSKDLPLHVSRQCNKTSYPCFKDFKMTMSI
jgi:hypothetical protein